MGPGTSWLTMIKKILNKIIGISILISLFPIDTVFSSPRTAYDRFYQGVYREIALGEPEEAIEIYREIVIDQSNKPEPAGMAAIRIGICLEETGKRSEAIEWYKDARLDFSDFPSIRGKLSEGLVRLYTWSPAPREEIVQETLPDLISRGLEVLDAGSPYAAKELFEEALAIDPKNRYLQLLTAGVCRKLAQYPEAIYYYNQVINSSEYRLDLSVYQALADCYKESGAPENGISLWYSYPRLHDADIRRIIEYELHLLYEAADASGNEMVTVELKELLDIGEEQTRNGRYGPAAETYRQARERYPGSCYPPYRLAFLVKHFQDKPKVAIWYYKESSNKATGRFALRLREMVRGLEGDKTTKK